MLPFLPEQLPAYKDVAFMLTAPSFPAGSCWDVES
jgi:hypothetical protein